MSDEAYEVALRQELERRIAEISAHGDEDFGLIGPGEWALFCLLAVLLPAALVWWAA